MEQKLLTLILITLGIFVIPFIAPLMRLPVAVGELLYGIGLLLLFQHFHFGEETLVYIDFLSFLGFSLLMFLAGLEIDWNRLETLRRREKAVIALVLATNFLLSLAVVKWFKLPLPVGLLLSSMGIGLMLTVLRELDIPERLSQLVLIAGSLGEVFTLLLLTLYDLYLTFHLGVSLYLHLALIGVFGLLFALLLKVLKLLVWYFPEKVAALVLEETKAAVDIRASFALMLLFMAFTSLIHVEPILGAFIAGVLLGFVFREKEHFEGRLSAFGYGFLIPFFFIQVGLSFDFSALSPLFLKLTLSLTLGLFVLKLLSSVWLKLLGFGWREILLAALLFSFPFTVLIAIGKILHGKGVWSSTDFGVVVLLTILSSVIYPFLLKVLTPSKTEKG